MPIDALTETLEVVTVEIDHRLYAFRLANVQEIVRMVEITEAPNSPDFIEGVVNLRGEIIPIVDFRKRLKLPPKPYSLKTPILFMKSVERKYGVTLDRVVEVSAVPRQDISSAMDVGSHAKYMEAVAKTEDKILFIVDTERFLDFSDYTESAGNKDLTGVRENDIQEELDQTILKERAKVLASSMDHFDVADWHQVISFDLGQESYALRSDEIVEVIDIKKVTKVPRAPSGIAGVINLRGEVISIIDLKRIFEISKDERREKAGQIIIVELASHKFGLLVDEVKGLETLEDKQINQPIATLDQQKSEFIEGEADVNGVIHAIIKVKKILDSVKR